MLMFVPDHLKTCKTICKNRANKLPFVMKYVTY